MSFSLEMHDLSDKFQIYSNQIASTDIHQGALGDCYLLAAFASLVNVDKGYYINHLFESNVPFIHHSNQMTYYIIYFSK